MPLSKCQEDHPIHRCASCAPGASSIASPLLITASMPAWPLCPLEAKAALVLFCWNAWLGCQRVLSSALLLRFAWCSWVGRCRNGVTGLFRSWGRREFSRICWNLCWISSLAEFCTSLGRGKGLCLRWIVLKWWTILLPMSLLWAENTHQGQDYTWSFFLWWALWVKARARTQDWLCSLSHVSSRCFSSPAPPSATSHVWLTSVSHISWCFQEE